MLFVPECNASSYIHILKIYFDPLFCERPNTFKCCKLVSTFKFKKFKELCLFMNQSVRLENVTPCTVILIVRLRKKTSTCLIVL